MLDLHSGKLHREFHHGPDPVQEVPQVEVKTEDKPATGETGAQSGQNVPFRKEPCWVGEVFIGVKPRLIRLSFRRYSS